MDSSSPSPGSSRPSSPAATPPLKVVHIFSPRIFRTDAENFRTLVQCLTGNNRTNDLCDDSWIPDGCVELTPRKRHSSNFSHHLLLSQSKSHTDADAAAAAAAAAAAVAAASAATTTQAFGLGRNNSGRFHDIDIVSGLISSDTPDADWLPPFAPDPSINLWTCQA